VTIEIITELLDEFIEINRKPREKELPYCHGDDDYFRMRYNTFRPHRSLFRKTLITIGDMLHRKKHMFLTIRGLSMVVSSI
jgi:hypothetical protein